MARIKEEDMRLRLVVEGGNAVRKAMADLKDSIGSVEDSLKSLTRQRNAAIRAEGEESASVKTLNSRIQDEQKKLSGSRFSSRWHTFSPIILPRRADQRTVSPLFVRSGAPEGRSAYSFAIFCSLRCPGGQILVVFEAYLNEVPGMAGGPCCFSGEKVQGPGENDYFCSRL